jgi:CO dehydrogenase maturation factor
VAAVRLAVCGKGGSGKTTVAGTLARLLAREGHRVLAVDGDSGPNLGLALGLPPAALDAAPTLTDDLLALGDGPPSLTAPLAAVRRRCAVRAPDGVELLVMARAEEAGTGCLSRRHAIVRELLGEVPAGEACVLDMEPTPEAFSRSVPRHADALLVLVEPSPPAHLHARRVVALARDLGLERIDLAASKARDTGDEAAVAALASALRAGYAGAIPDDPALPAAERDGRAPLDAAPAGAAVAAVASLARHYVWRAPTAAGTVGP